jgi:hypothetical protein
MNDQQRSVGKKALIGLGLLVAFLFIYSVISSSMMGSTFSLSGGTGMMSAPGLAVNQATVDYAMPPSAITGRVAMMGKGDIAYEAIDAYAPVPTSPAAPAMVSKIVKNGSLSLLVENVDTAALGIAAIRTELGGQQGNESISQYGSGGRSGYVTIWVPSDKFDQAMTALKKLGVRVEQESVSVQDVSAQYVDLESRIKNLKASEEQYLLILKQSGKIPDILAVTQQLNQTRGEIEQAQGQLDYLSRQVALSSISITLREEAVPSQVTSEWRPFTVVKAAWKSTLSDLTGFVDMLLILVVRLPILLLYLVFWGAILYALYRVARFTYRRLATPSEGK